MIEYDDIIQDSPFLVNHLISMMIVHTVTALVLILQAILKLVQNVAVKERLFVNNVASLE